MAPEIAIVGGGPSGLALAGALERAGLNYIVYERSAKDTPPRGGCLDLHIGSGQDAMREAGCFEKFKKHGRLGDATVHRVWDNEGNVVFAWGEGRDAPEIDRFQLKQALLTTIPEDKILWRKHIKSSTRNEQGQIVLSFADGTTATGFKLVVGADGTWTKIRHLVTPATPQYAGMTYITGEISASNSFYPTVEKMAGAGPMVVMGRSTSIWNQRQGTGVYRVDLGFLRPENFLKEGSTDLTDTEGIKALMLQDDFFGGHTPAMKTMIEALEGPFYAWPLYYIPPESLNWKAASDVTLIGDAAHTTTPFVGDGANCALRDSVVLSRKLKQLGLTQEAIAEYEKDMFQYAVDVINRSIASGKLFFDWNSPKVFMEAMQAHPLIGTELGD